MRGDDYMRRNLIFHLLHSSFKIKKKYLLAILRDGVDEDEDGREGRGEEWMRKKKREGGSCKM